jgi:putative membrane protein
MLYNWAKAFHIIFMVTWFAGLFYLPRLFVYHAMMDKNDEAGNARFKVMEYKLYYYITTPGAILTAIFGVWTWSYMWNYLLFGWFHMKLGLVVLLIIYHIYCGKLLHDFKQDRNHHDHVFYRFFNEVPTFILIVVIILTAVKPF